MFVPVRYADAVAAFNAFTPLGGSVLEEVMTDKDGWKRKKGDDWESADEDWSKLEAPGGFDGAKTLEWSECDKYLYH